MNRKWLGIVVGVLLIGVLAFGAIGTGAWFSDTETSEDNLFTAGTLDLTVYGDPGMTLTIGPVYPGFGFTRYTWILLKNVGNLPGELDIKISAITNTESTGPTEYENDDIGGAGVGELGDNFMVCFHIGGYHLVPPTPVCNSTINQHGGQEWDGGTNARIKLACGATGTELLDPGQEVYFLVEGFVPGGVGNSIQGDSFTFDVTFTLEQPEVD